MSTSSLLGGSILYTPKELAWLSRVLSDPESSWEVKTVPGRATLCAQTSRPATKFRKHIWYLVIFTRWTRRPPTNTSSICSGVSFIGFLIVQHKLPLIPDDLPHETVESFDLYQPRQGRLANCSFTRSIVHLSHHYVYSTLCSTIGSLCLATSSSAPVSRWLSCFGGFITAVDVSLRFIGYLISISEGEKNKWTTYICTDRVFREYSANH